MIGLLPESAPPDRAHLGGKGFALYQLDEAGFKVPAWFAVAPNFAQVCRPTADRIVAYSFPREHLADIREQLRVLGGDRFAVRSSAVDEDGSESSFAGQLDSFLNVPEAEVPNRIRDVWTSLHSARLAAYRKEHGLSEATALPAVIVQRMLRPEAAGVAFSVDAIGGRSAIAVVSAVRGLGEALVSGAADADTWMIDRAGRIFEFHPASPEEIPCLADGQAAAVAQLARECEQQFGRPQDIEWAFENGELFLLQSRPITTLGRLPDPDGVLNIWDNSNIAESYGGVTTPLTFSFAHYIYKEVYQQFCRIMHVPESVIAANRSIFNSMLGLIRGRVYYNLMSWYRMLALLPGFRFNRGFMEQMMGVKEGLPESVLREFEAQSLGARLRDAGRLSWALLGLVRAQTFLPRMIRRFHRHFDNTLAAIPVPLEAMRPDQLAGHFHQLEDMLLSQWNAPLVNDFFAMIYFGLLRSLTAKWCDDQDGTLQNGLLCGTGNIISAEPAKRIHEMGEIAAQDDALARTLAEAPLREIRAQLDRSPEFAAAYHSYLERFADRCLNELKLESATLRDDPLPLLRSVGSLALRLRVGAKPVRDIEKKLQRESESQVRARLKGRPLRRLVFDYVLRQARRRVRDRENLRFERTRLFGRIRAIFIESGKRFHASGLLEDPRDIFYLGIEEVIGFVEGTGTTLDLRGLVELRRREYAAFEREPAPADRFETHGAVHLGNRFEASSASSAPVNETAELRGIGCCPGIVRGRARVVTDPASASLKAGEILVAQQTDPGWITLFPAASGVLVERGSLLSHSAIVSREMGIPAVVSVRGLLDSVKTGDLLEFNGQSGLIRKLDDHD